jgi:hypothetical protein
VNPLEKDRELMTMPVARERVMKTRMKEFLMDRCLSGLMRNRSPEGKRRRHRK